MCSRPYAEDLRERDMLQDKSFHHFSYQRNSATEGERLQESKSNELSDNVVVPMNVDTIETLPMPSNARLITANKEVRDCLKFASVAVANDPLLRDYMQTELPNQQSVQRVLFLLEENIPLKTLVDHLKETDDVSSILSGLVQVSLRDEITNLKGRLKKSQEVRRYSRFDLLYMRSH
jgi:hypothetical protein